jgi:hypothetical protein
VILAGPTQSIGVLQIRATSLLQPAAPIRIEPPTAIGVGSAVFPRYEIALPINPHTDDDPEWDFARVLICVTPE